jgi:hypothetical protein
VSKTTNSLKIVTLLVLGASAGAANASPLPFINGTISFSGGLNPAALGTTTYVASQINHLYGTQTGLANTGTKNYSLLGGANALLQLLDISSAFAMHNALIWKVGGFSFIASNIFSGPTHNPLLGTGGNLSDAETFRFIGTVKSAGFQDTPFLADFTVNGNCIGVGTRGPCTVAGSSTGSWSASISSNGQLSSSIPEPATFGLFGIGLAGWAVSRRTTAKTAAAE